MQREGLKTSRTAKHSPRRILFFVAALFVVTVVVLGGYEFLLREMHRDGGTDKESARRLRRQGTAGGDSDDASAGTKASASDADVSAGKNDGSGSNPPEDGADSKRGGYRQRKSAVALAPEQKEERRKALARSLLEQRAKAAADGTAISTRLVVDDDWRKDGFAQKPSWWDRYQKVQATQRAQQQQDGKDGGVLQSAASAWNGWEGTDAMDACVCFLLSFRGAGIVARRFDCTTVRGSWAAVRQSGPMLA